MQLIKLLSAALVLLIPINNYGQSESIKIEDCPLSLRQLDESNTSETYEGGAEINLNPLKKLVPKSGGSTADGVLSGKYSWSDEPQPPSSRTSFNACRLRIHEEVCAELDSAAAGFSWFDRTLWKITEYKQTKSHYQRRLARKTKACESVLHQPAETPGNIGFTPRIRINFEQENVVLRYRGQQCSLQIIAYDQRYTSRPYSVSIERQSAARVIIPRHLFQLAPGANLELLVIELETDSVIGHAKEGQ